MNESNTAEFESLAGRVELDVFDENASVQVGVDFTRSLIRLRPDVYEEFGEACGILEFPVFIAGNIGASAIGRLLRGLTVPAEEVFKDFVDGKLSAQRFAQHFVSSEVAVQLLFQQIAPEMRTLIQWNTVRILSETDFLNWYVDKYATGNDEVTANNVRTACNHLRADASGQYTDPTFAGFLDGLAQQYSRPVANTVATAALHPDISDIDALNPPLDHLEQLNLTARCRTLANEVDSLSTVEGIPSVAHLEEELVSACDLPVDQSTSGEESLPLIDVPKRTSSPSHEASVSAIDTDLTGYPTGLTWLLSKSFTDGCFGGVVYPHENGNPDWLINPWADVQTNGSYRKRWTQTVVIDAMRDRIVSAALHGDQTVAKQNLHCPLCGLSEHACGGDQCAYRKSIVVIRQNFDRLVQAVLTEMDTYAPAYVEAL